MLHEADRALLEKRMAGTDAHCSRCLTAGSVGHDLEIVLVTTEVPHELRQTGMKAWSALLVQCREMLPCYERAAARTPEGTAAGAARP